MGSMDALGTKLAGEAWACRLAQQRVIRCGDQDATDHLRARVLAGWLCTSGVHANTPARGCMRLRVTAGGKGQGGGDEEEEVACMSMHSFKAYRGEGRGGGGTRGTNALRGVGLQGK